MQDKTNLPNWDELLQSEDAVMQIKAVIAGREYLGYDGETGVWSARAPAATFEKPMAGNCAGRKLDLDIFLPDDAVIPSAAKISLYTRLARLDDRTVVESTGYIPKGEFYIDTRRTDKATGMYSFEAYDAMRKTETPFMRAGDQGVWPRTDISVVEEICERIGVTLDPRTQAVLTNGYAVQYPGYGEGAYTMREVLGFVGAMYAGNWIINDLGYAQLLRLGDIPPETHYLVNERGYAITIGGVRILV